MTATVIAAATIACADDPDDDPCAYRLCVVRSEACVQQVAAAVACQREVDELTPEVRFLSTAEVLVEWTAEPLPPEEIELQRQYFAAEALVGLMPEGYEPTDATADQLENIAAFYDRDSGGITIITDSGIDDAAASYEILVHEMTHAYQDAEWDLDAVSEAHASTWDRFFALRAAIEGDATLYQNFAALALLELEPDEVDWQAYFDDYQQAMLELAWMSEAPSIEALSLFPYAFGVAYIHPAWESLDVRASETVVLDPPDSVRQVMRGYPGAPRPAINEDALLEPTAVPLLAGYTFLGGGNQGTWLLNAMLQRTANSQSLFASTTLDLVSADYFSAFRHDASGEIAAVWRIRGGSAVATVVEQSGSLWSSSDPNETRHAWHDVDGDLVLVVVGASPDLDATALFEAIEGWQSSSDAEAAAGIEGGPRRRDPPWACSLHASR